MSSIPVNDPFSVAEDPQMPFLEMALNPADVRRQINRCLPGLAGENGEVSLCAIRVVRYKRGRRCLIEYDMESERPDAVSGKITLIGKVRAKGLDKSNYIFLKLLQNAGFGDYSRDEVSIPDPVGVIPEFQMWLQRKVPGAAATRMLLEAGGVRLAGRVAEAAHKIHRSNVTPYRRHTMRDELRILRERLRAVAEIEPGWSKRLERLLNSCDRLGAAAPETKLRGIHRDFYPDQVIVDGSRLYLLDFDLYCEGDPALDIGNFLGHLTEQGLRTLGDPDALADRESAIEERFLELSNESTRAVVQTYKTLTLARHVYISTQFPERRLFTERLLEICERRLGNAGVPYCGARLVTK